MDVNRGALSAMVGDVARGMPGLRPTENPAGFVGAHVDTTVTHFCAKIFMPVSAMEGVTRCGFAGRGDEGRPGNAGEDIAAFVGEQVAALSDVKVTVAHMLGRHFLNNHKFAIGRGGGESLVATQAAAAYPR